MHFKSTKFSYDEACEGWLPIIECSPTAIAVVDESNTIMWMNAMAYTLFKVSTETQTDELKWDTLVFSLGPDGVTPNDLLTTSASVDTLGPFKAFLTDDSNTRVEVQVHKVKFGYEYYTCCYVSPDTKEENVLRNSLDAVVQADLDKNIIGWNSAAESTFGYTEKEITGKPLATIFPRRNSKGENDVYEFLLKHKEACVNRIVGVTGQRKDGKEIPLEMAVSALNYANGTKYFSFFIRDLSQLKCLEQMKTVEEASQAKSVFVSSISHELRSPLNTIFGFGQLLTEMALSTEQLEYVHGIISASETLIQLVSDMADLSKIEAHKIDLESVPFSVSNIVNDVINSGLVMARSKKIEIGSFVSYESSCTVLGDPRRLKQVLVNLVNNGIKFTDTGSVVVTVDITQQCADSCKFMFQVTDTGIGIAQEDVGKLFKRFSQLNSQRYGGSGLGLAISSELVRLMGGEIGVFSGGRGKGSTLWFSCKFDLHSNHPIPEVQQKPLNPFEAVVAYKEESIGCKFSKFVSQSYNIDYVPYMATMDDLLNYLDAYKPTSGKQVVVLVDDELPGFVEKFKIAKLKSKPMHHFVIIKSTTDKMQADGSQCPCDLTLLKPINQAKIRTNLDPFNLLVKMISQGMVRSNSECRRVVKEAATKAKILIAEDNTLNFLITQKMLSSAGYECHQASNGYEVLQQLAQGSYSLVLMDCMMPRLDGYATTKLIRECCNVTNPPLPTMTNGATLIRAASLPGDSCHSPRIPPPALRGRRPSIATIPHGIPVVAMTANAMRGDREKCLSVGMDDYISKPFQKQQLLDIVQKWVPDS